MERLKNKVAIVTGGGRDIGKAVSIKLASEGAKVCLNYNESEKEAEETKKVIDDSGGVVEIVQADLTKEFGAAHLIEKCRHYYGENIDILVNNSGGLLARKKLDEIDLEFWEKVISLNLTTTFLATKAAVPHMKTGGSIVNLSSQAARDGGGTGASAYATSKGGVLSFTKAMAKELGSKNIRVNAVSAGIINTSFHDKFTKPEVRKKITDSSPLGREGEAEEVADLVFFLASDESSYINGASVEINGGLYLI